MPIRSIVALLCANRPHYNVDLVIVVSGWTIEGSLKLEFKSSIGAKDKSFNLATTWLSGTVWVGSFAISSSDSLMSSFSYYVFAP